VARANPLWRQDGAAVLAIFQGPSGYVSPELYDLQAVDGRAVPTWNYAVVHAHGRLRTVDDPEWLLAHMRRMTQRQEDSARPRLDASTPRRATTSTAGAGDGGHRDRHRAPRGQVEGQPEPRRGRTRAHRPCNRHEGGAGPPRRLENRFCTGHGALRRKMVPLF
jgi:hypothetical protein